MAEAIQSNPFDHWKQVFEKIDACVEPVNSLTRSLDHPQIQARELVVDVPDGDTTRRQAGFPVKFSGFTPEYRFAGADIGAHTLEILEQAGYDKDEAEGLVNSGAVYQMPDRPITT